MAAVVRNYQCPLINIIPLDSPQQGQVEQAYHPTLPPWPCQGGGGPDERFQAAAKDYKPTKHYDHQAKQTQAPTCERRQQILLYIGRYIPTIHDPRTAHGPKDR